MWTSEVKRGSIPENLLPLQSGAGSVVNRALKEGGGVHTPMLLNKALSWHIRFQETGSMKIK